MSEEVKTASGAADNTGTAAGAAGGEGGSAEGATSWLDSLPDDLKGNEALKAYKDPGEVAKALLDAQSKLPQVPEGPDKYTIEIPKDHPFDPGFVTAFKGWAHKEGLTQAQAANLAAAYVAMEQAAIKEMQIADQKELEAFKKECGSTYDEIVNLAMDGFHKFATDEEKEWARKTGLADDPKFVRLWSRVGKAIADDKLHEGGAGGLKEMPRTPGGTPLLDFPSMRKDKT